MLILECVVVDAVVLVENSVNFSAGKRCPVHHNDGFLWGPVGNVNSRLDLIPKPPFVIAHHLIKHGHTHGDFFGRKVQADDD